MIDCAYSMPLPDTVETYKYFITEAEKLDLSYIALVRYVPGGDMEIDGGCFTFPKRASNLLVFP